MPSLCHTSSACHSRLPTLTLVTSATKMTGSDPTFQLGSLPATNLHQSFVSHSDRYHHSLITCLFEPVKVSKSSDEVAFPWVAHRWTPGTQPPKRKLVLHLKCSGGLGERGVGEKDKGECRSKRSGMSHNEVNPPPAAVAAVIGPPLVIFKESTLLSLSS